MRQENATPPNGALAMCAARDDGGPIRQGDIFAATRDEHARPVGVIVTNDCDIAQNKAWQFLTWVPLVPVDSYIASCWALNEVSARPSPGRFAGWLRSTSRTARRIAQAEVIANGENE